MTTEITLFHFDDSQPNFEQLGKPNGATHWTEEDLRSSLGYQSEESFAKAMRRAKQTCLTLGMDTEEHFARQPNGRYYLTRFACYLVAMNGDPRKPQVAAAQAYFAAIASTFQSHLDHTDGIERLLIRDEIVDGQKALSSTASRHGVQNFPFFLDAGYLGMYNMRLSRLCEFKGTQKDKLLDRMGKAEMAAHLFRITQTDEKIKNENIQGQAGLERAANTVGKTVRKTMIEMSGSAPEHLPLAENVGDVRKKIKGAGKKLLDADKKKSPKKK